MKPCNRAPIHLAHREIIDESSQHTDGSAALAFVAAPAFAAPAFATPSLGYHVNIKIQTPTCHGTCTTGGAGTIASGNEPS